MRNLKRFNLEKEIKRIQTIQNSLNEESIKKEIISLISKIARNQSFGGQELYSLIYKPKKEARIFLRIIKRRLFVEKLLSKHNIEHNLISKIIFSEYSFVDSVKKICNRDVQKTAIDIKADFLLNCKKAQKLKSSAMNFVNMDKKIKGIVAALDAADVGSVESLECITLLSRLLNGESVGKTFSDLRMEVVNKQAAQNNKTITTP